MIDRISCKNCGKEIEYIGRKCLEDSYKCGNCGHSNPNENQNANIKRYAKDYVPHNIEYEILEKKIWILEDKLAQHLDCTLMSLEGIRKKNFIQRKKIGGYWRYDWILYCENRGTIKILLSRYDWYNRKKANVHLDFPPNSDRLSTFRKNDNVIYERINTRYFYKVTSLDEIKKKLEWPTKKDVIEKLSEKLSKKISEYRFNKMRESGQFGCSVKISNQWHVEYIESNQSP